MWLNWVEMIAVAALCTLCSKYYVHMLQLESYQLDGYLRWANKNRNKLLGWTLNVGVVFTVAYYGLNLLLGAFFGTTGQVIGRIITLLGFAATALALFERQSKQPQKKPLVFTARVKRLYVALGVVSLAGTAILNFLGLPGYLLFIATPYLALVAGYIMQPVEKGINNHYLNDAKAKLAARDDLIKIGITGSFGKTSTKFVLAAILSEKFDVLATPSSFNTPMGLTRVIREQLEPHHQVFIAEMGARHVGDIKELVDLVHPKYGMITSVGPQHLETFGNVSTVANTKFELIEGLPKDGVGFFAADGGEVDKLFKRAKCEKYQAGLEGGYLDMRAEDIEVGPFGSRFTLVSGQGERVKCETKMLGRHNIQNIVLCCALARHLGMTMEEIARGMTRVQPVEHRLQILPGAGGITVIDDAFNANPAGAKAAMEVLKGFPGRRIVVTPGMVELGEQEEKLNYLFGQQMADSCDVAILVGRKRCRPMVQAMVEKGFQKEDLHVVADLNEATRILGQIGQSGDVVLFENDLPDNYSEN